MFCVWQGRDAEPQGWEIAEVNQDTNFQETSIPLLPPFTDAVRSSSRAARVGSAALQSSFLSKKPATFEFCSPGG